MDTVIGIVTAVISGVIVRFLFELLMDWVIKPYRSFLDFRGNLVYAIEVAKSSMFAPVGIGTTSRGTMRYDQLTGDHLESFSRLQDLAKQAAGMAAARSKCAFRTPKKPQWRAIESILYSLSHLHAYNNGKTAIKPKEHDDDVHVYLEDLFRCLRLPQSKNDVDIYGK